MDLTAKSFAEDDCEKPRHRDTPPSFAVWRAQQLRSRDLLFAVIASIVVLNYVRVTVPVLCTYNPNAPQQLQQQQQHQGELLWDVACGRWPRLLEQLSPTLSDEQHPFKNTTAEPAVPGLPAATQSSPFAGAGALLLIAQLCQVSALHSCQSVA